MNITLGLKPEIAASLITQAAAKGVSVEQYLQSWIENNLPTETEQPLSQPETTENWRELLDAFSNNPALANAPPLSDEAINRESIYREREDSQL
jgi:hypothetical protein